MKTIIISIGDELLAGDIVNTNAAFIAAELTKVNVELIKIISVGDDYTEIITALKTIPNSVKTILITGGLGPTNDDITKKAATAFFDTKLVFNNSIFQDIKLRFQNLGLEMTEANKSQAYIPKTCKIIPNPNGTAVGMKLSKNKQDFYFIPGVPHEMKHMVTDQIIPQLTQQQSTEKTLVLRTFGMGESNLYESMKQWMAQNPTIKVAFYPGYDGIDIKLQYSHQNAESIKTLLTQLTSLIYGFNQEKIEEKIADQLLKKNRTIAVAESCTGGLVSSRLTDIPGSSGYMMQGVVSYSNAAKVNILGVKEDTIKNHGAVSKQVAEEMALAVRKINNCDIGVSSTGIAGPTGGTKEKPVGTLWIAVSMDDQLYSHHFCRNINRQANKRLFSQFLFKKLLEKLN